MLQLNYWMLMSEVVGFGGGELFEFESAANAVGEQFGEVGEFADLTEDA